jgi:predicted transcriptional regulator
MKLSEMKVVRRGRPPRVSGDTVEMIFDPRRLRERHGVSLREVAEASGVSHATIARVEVGWVPSVENALKLAAFYELPVEKMWRLKEGE